MSVSSSVDDQYTIHGPGNEECMYWRLRVLLEVKFTVMELAISVLR